jgi:hypothetical protein
MMTSPPASPSQVMACNRKEIIERKLAEERARVAQTDDGPTAHQPGDVSAARARRRLRVAGLTAAFAPMAKAAGKVCPENILVDALCP